MEDALNALVPIDFHGHRLFTLKLNDGAVVVAMKPIIEGMGLNWSSQCTKIKTSQRYGDIAIPLNTPGGPQEMLCIPLAKLNGWLFSINPSKIPDLEVRARVVTYQEECFTALYDYWHHGAAFNPRKYPDLTAAAKFAVALEKAWSAYVKSAKKSGLKGNVAVLQARNAMLTESGVDVFSVMQLDPAQYEPPAPPAMPEGGGMDLASEFFRALNEIPEEELRLFAEVKDDRLMLRLPPAMKALAGLGYRFHLRHMDLTRSLKRHPAFLQSNLCHWGRFGTNTRSAHKVWVLDSSMLARHLHAAEESAPKGDTE